MLILESSLNVVINYILTILYLFQVALKIGNEQTYFQAHTASELNETEKKFQR